MTRAPEQWHTMPTQMLLERSRDFAKQDPDSEAASCILALTWRLKGSEEWIEGLARHPKPPALDAALRSYGRRLGELTRQYPFSTIEMGSAIREDAGDVAAHFYNSLLDVFFEAGLIPPRAHATLADWFLDEAL